MTTTIENTADAIDVSKLVYIRTIRSGELADLPNDALDTVNDVENLVVVTNGEGKKLAIIEGHDAAIAAAHAYSLEPVSVH